MRLLSLFGFFNPIEMIKRCMLTIDPGTAMLIAAGISGGVSLFGGKDDKVEYEQPQIPQWMQDAYQQTWGEVSAPAQYGEIPQSAIDLAMADIEKQYADYMMGGTYGYNTKNMLDSGIYKEQYLPKVGEQQATAMSRYMADVDYQNAMMKGNAEQGRLSNMSSFIGGMGGVYGTPASQAAGQYSADIASRDYASQQSGQMGAGLGSILGMYQPQAKTGGGSNYGDYGNTFNQYSSGLGDYSSNLYAKSL